MLVSLVYRVAHAYSSRHIHVYCIHISVAINKKHIYLFKHTDICIYTQNIFVYIYILTTHVRQPSSTAFGGRTCSDDIEQNKHDTQTKRTQEKRSDNPS